MMILASVSFGAYSILGLLAKAEVIISSTLNCCPPPFTLRDFLPTPSAIICGTDAHIGDENNLFATIVFCSQFINVYPFPRLMIM